MNHIQFFNKFNSPDACLSHLELVVWGADAPLRCDKCGCDRHYKLNVGRPTARFQCAGCRNRPNARQNTLFDNCKIPLPTFFYLLYQFSSNKKSISSRQTAKNIGVSQKTAWTASQKIRSIFCDDGRYKLSGVVEIDEAFFTKTKVITYCTNRISKKGPILGMIQRGGKVIVRTIPDRKTATIEEMILRYVQPESTVFTDGWMGYKNLDKYFDHHWIDHSGNEYSRGVVHTNSIEGFWGHMKKSLRAAHHSVSEEHLQLYLDQVSWEWNNRHLTSMQRFDDLFLRCIKSKLTAPTKPKLLEMAV